jgi:hypothetical protein
MPFGVTRNERIILAALTVVLVAAVWLLVL